MMMACIHTRQPLKGAYGKEATLKPVQYDSKGVKLPDDFMLNYRKHGKRGCGICTIQYA